LKRTKLLSIIHVGDLRGCFPFYVARPVSRPRSRSSEENSFRSFSNRQETAPHRRRKDPARRKIQNFLFRERPSAEGATG